MKRGSPHLGQDEIRIPYFEFEKNGKRKKKQVTYAIHPNKTNDKRRSQYQNCDVSQIGITYRNM